MGRTLRASEAFVAGISATLIALAVLGLASLLQPGVPFPPFGLAQRALRAVPGPLAVFFIERLGHLALRLFVAGFTVGSVAAGGLAGIAVGRRPAWARTAAAWVAAGVLAAVAAGGYRSQPGALTVPIWLLLVAGAAVAWAVTLTGALDRLARDPVPPPATGLGRTRREFLRAAVGAAGLLGVGLALRRLTGGLGDRGGGPLARPAGAVLRPAAGPAETAADASFTTIKGLTPEVTPNRLHYTVDESIIDPDVDAAAWRLEVGGLVGRPASLGYDQLLALPALEQYVTLQCISNLVGGDLVSTAKWTGVPLRDVLARAGGVAPGAVRVVFHAVGGYSDSLPVAKALEPTTLVAYGMNDRSLPRAHGYPARILAPGIYGMKNVKWLERIEVVDYDYRGYWQRSDGWDNVAVVKTASRVDVPAELAAIAGPATVAGVAWAGDRGIRRVEVSLDDGRTWTPAVLRRQLAPAAWRQWRLPWVPSGNGRVRVKVRAVDGRGALQTDRPAPPHPSGASGYHGIEVVVGK
jgi:DMSO/TMAO reductase YedYZ molybdopterin-dependent catalytic subunit